MFPLYLSHFLTDFNAISNIVYPMHAPQVQQYSDLFYHLVIPEHTLHIRVKGSITHISIVICSFLREDCYIYVNCDSTILCKTSYYFGYELAIYSEFFKV